MLATEKRRLLLFVDVTPFVFSRGLSCLRGIWGCKVLPMFQMKKNKLLRGNKATQNNVVPLFCCDKMRGPKHSTQESKQKCHIHLTHTKKTQRLLTCLNYIFLINESGNCQQLFFITLQHISAGTDHHERMSSVCEACNMEFLN